VLRPKACAAAEARCPVVLHLGAYDLQAYNPIGALLAHAGFVYASALGPIDATAIPNLATCARTLGGGAGPAKIGAFGSGLGGYSTLLAATKLAGTFDAAAAFGAVSGFDTIKLSTAGDYGLAGATDEAKAALSPANFLAAVSRPLLLLEVQAPWDHPVGDTFQLTLDLEKRGADVTFYWIPDERSSELQELVAAQLLAFFERSLSELR
jgi:hypothetical protein